MRTLAPKLIGPHAVWRSQNEQRRMFATLPTLTHAPAASRDLTGAYQQFTASWLQQVQGYPVPKPDAAAPSLTIGWSVVASSPKLVAIRTETYEFAGANGATTFRTHWLDLANDTLIAPQDLIAPTKRSQFTTTVRALLKKNADVMDGGAAPVLPSGPAQSLDRHGGDLAFNPNGDLLIGYPQGEIGPSSAGPMSVTVPRGVVTGMLSDSGKRAQQASVKPTAVARNSTVSPTTVPAPEPVDCAVKKCVALTFDDGPAASTKTVVDTLVARDARATFFMLGTQVSASPDLAKYVASAGMEVGNHTWSHKQLTGLSPEQVRQELTRTNDAIKSAIGTAPRYFRPPYGAHSSSVDAVAHSTRLVEILWDVDTLDWKNRNSAAVTKAVQSGVHRGAIVLMHDIHPTTAAALPGILDLLKQQGYTVVPLHTLIGDKDPGSVVNSGRR